MKLTEAIRLGAEGLHGILDPEEDFLPVRGYEIAHDLGRWWDAALRVEACLGISIPETLEKKALSHLQTLTDNPDRLLMNNERIDACQGKVNRNPHNYRETFLAYAALIRYRQCPWVEAQALELVQALDRDFINGRLDYSKNPLTGKIPESKDPFVHEKGHPWFDGTATSGRALEGLMILFSVFPQKEISNLAQRIAEHHLAYSTLPDGSARQEIFDPENIGHNHSYHSTLKGLFLYGLETRDNNCLETVHQTYRQVLQNGIVHRSGWTPHDLGKFRFFNDHGDPQADPASAGDSAQLALWLAKLHGQNDLTHDVKRLVGFRLLPSQLTREEWIQLPEKERHSRELGSWRIHRNPHSQKGCTPDVHAAVLHSLCDIYETLGDLDLDSDSSNCEIEEWSETMPSDREFHFQARGFQVLQCRPREQPQPYYP